MREQKIALRPTKSQTYMVRDIPGSIPSRLVWVEGKVLITSYLKPQKLLRWINSDKYG
ncbi:hypothetical protein [Thermocrinis sp.]